MKKLLLLLLTTGVAVGANAQQNANESVVFKSYNVKYKNITGDYTSTLKKNNGTSVNKTTGTGGARWYVPFDVTDQYLGNALQNNRFVFPIDWDSTLQQKFNTGYGPVNWLSMAEFVDPIYSKTMNLLDDNYFAADDIRVWPKDSYKVDSIQFNAAYVLSPTGLTSTHDTLYLSVAPVAYNTQSYTTTDYATVTNYDKVTENGGVLKVQTLGTTDSVERALGNPGAIVWKYVLPDTLRKPKTSSGQYTTNLFSLPVPNGGLTVGAGSGFAISVAFRPGEAYAKGDSVQQHHYFMPLSAEYQDNGQMPYHYYLLDDRSMYYLRHYSSSRYSSAIGLELVNGVAYSYEYGRMGGHIVCSTCWDLSVGRVNQNLNDAIVFPNPASEEVGIKFSTKNAANVNVTLTNSLGQVVATQSFGKTTSAKATFNVSGLAAGVYMYAIEADGERETGRVVVAH